MKARKFEIYKTEVMPKLTDEFKYSNVMQIPILEKIVINTCMSEAIQNVKLLHAAAHEIELISGQKPVITRAKKSVSNFKLREGMPLGAKVTLRREQLIFPELKFDDVKKVNGMNITFVTSANTDAEALALLKHLGMPFKDNNK